jgi:hypothetical protein
MSFFTVEPEASGAPESETSGKVVSCLFDTWLGDDLVRAYPAVLVTTPVREALLDLRQPTGFVIARARIRTSGFFRRQHPGVRLPPFWSIGVGGAPGRDDMGLTPAGVLVVSQRILDVLMDFRIGRAVLAQYAPGRRARLRQEER